MDSQDRVAEIRLELPTSGYSVFALRGGVRLGEGVQLGLAVENLTDREYVRHLNALDPFDRSRIPEIGRYLTVGATYSY